MRKTESLFTIIILIGAITVTAGALWRGIGWRPAAVAPIAADGKFGAFLAAQHAIYINDFARAADFTSQFQDLDYPIVQNVRIMSEFLDGRIPSDAQLLKSEKGAAARLMYDTYLAANDNWDELYSRHKGDDSAIASPLRIWSSVATGRGKDAIKFIDKLKTNDSWQAFARGQVYVEMDDVDAAVKEFSRVSVDFLNINDYLYLMSFYNHIGDTDAANALRSEFVSRPGGMFMSRFDAVPEWENYAGVRNVMAFALLQNVSHTQIMMYSDLSLLMLRMAQIIGPAYGDNDALHYYLGQYFYTNGGDAAAQFSKIPQFSPFSPFATMRLADINGDITAIRRCVKDNPLFVPAVRMLVDNYVSNGYRRRALRVINTALDQPEISPTVRAFFTKSRAQVYYTFGEMARAQSDLHAASKDLPNDPDIYALQARIWAAQNRELDNAYKYAMDLVKRDPADVMAWDTLALVVAVREGNDAALEVLERIGEVAVQYSCLFEHLGDLYAAAGDVARARMAYEQALSLGDDGLIIMPNVRKKLKALK